METIVKILMKRDGLSRQEAESLIQETRSEILNSNPFEADEILSANLGLEPDYLFYIFM